MVQNVNPTHDSKAPNDDARDALLVPVRHDQPRPGTFTLPASGVDTTALIAGQLPWLRHHRVTGLPHREAYRLTLETTRIIIESQTDAGAFYALQTLRELHEIHGPSIPCRCIEDHPDFERRGVYFDCSRGKVPTVQTLCELIMQLARWKINELQLYIENVFAFPSHPLIGQGYDPFTADDLRTVQRHAAAHHIRLVPSLSSFGHMERVLCLPPYQSLAELPGHLGFTGGTTLNPGDPGSIRLMQELYSDFLPLFDADDFNACGDEPWELGKGRSKAAAESLGIGRLYINFMLKLRDAAQHHGKRLNMWGEVITAHPELTASMPRDIVMLNWDYDHDLESPDSRMMLSHRFIDAGLDLICCPGTNSWNRYCPAISDAMTNIRLFADEARRVGSLGLLNTDWGDTGHRNLQALSMPALCYGAAHAWNGRSVRDHTFLDRFTQRCFGDADGSLADAMRTLDNLLPQKEQRNLYHTLVEPLTPRDGYFDIIDPHSPVRMHWWDKPTRIEELDATLYEQVRDAALQVADALQEPQAGPTSLLFRELRFGARCMHVAAAHGVLAQRTRRGRPCSHSEASGIADGYEALSDELQTLWLARNRRSRLDDNLQLLRQVRNQYRRSARRPGFNPPRSAVERPRVAVTQPTQRVF